MDSKLYGYLSWIDEHVVQKTSRSEGLSDHCFATTLLLFAAMDGLGGLIVADDEASNENRFRSVLPYLGLKYVEAGDRLWKLRNLLAHSASTFGVFMSRAGGAESEHLGKYGEFMFIHTPTLAHDFRNAFASIAKLLDETSMGTEAASRLQPVAFEPQWVRHMETTRPPEEYLYVPRVAAPRRIVIKKVSSIYRAYYSDKPSCSAEAMSPCEAVVALECDHPGEFAAM